MNYVFKGITISKPEGGDWSVTAEQVNLHRVKQSLKADFKSYKQKRKQLIKRQISLLKLDLQSKKNELRGLREEVVAAKKQCQLQTKEAQRVAKTKQTAFYLNEKGKEIEQWKSDALELLLHKFGTNNTKDPAYLAAVNVIEDKAAAKTTEVKKYAADSSAIERDLAKQLQSYQVDMEETISSVAIRKVEALSALKISRQKTKETITAFRLKIHQDLVKRRVGLVKATRLARQTATAARKKIVESKIFLNAYYEPVLDEQIATKGAQTGKRLPLLTKDASLRFKLAALGLKTLARDQAGVQKSKLALLKQLSENHDLLCNQSFDWKARKIELSLRQEYEARILALLEERKELSAKDKVAFAQTLAGYDKAAEQAKRKEAAKALVGEHKQKRAAIIERYRAGQISRQTKRTSLRANRFDLKNNKRSLRIDDRLVSAKEKMRYDALETKFLIKKEYELMNSLIDDALKTIPTKAIKHQRWLAAILSFLVPGIGQMVNKQYAKGALLLLLAAFVYGFLLLLATGTISFSGGGVAGLGDLSPVQSSGVFTTYGDARFRLIEGLIGVMAIAVGLVALIMSARDAWWFGKAKELGIRPGNWRALKKYFAGSGLPYIMSIPAIVGVLFTVILPLAATLLLAFTNYSSGHIPPGNPLSWNGFENFKEVFSGAYGASFGYVATWTVIWTIAVSAGVIGVGTLLAFLGDQRRMKVKILWKTVFILPWAIPAFATILFFSTAFGGSGSGIYNQLFGVNTDFKQDTSATRAILIIIQIWLGHSYIFLLITGVKKSIPSDLYEAASIDGASKSRQFAMISAPLIMVQIAPLLIGQIVFNFNNYGVIFLFNDGGPLPAETYAGGPGSTDIFLSLIFKMTTSGSNNQVALASAFTIVISFFIVLVSAVGFVRSKAFKGVV